jgi:hypothetical protein
MYGYIDGIVVVCAILEKSPGVSQSSSISRLKWTGLTKVKCFSKSSDMVYVERRVRLERVQSSEMHEPRHVMRLSEWGAEREIGGRSRRDARQAGRQQWCGDIVAAS